MASSLLFVGACAPRGELEGTARPPPPPLDITPVQAYVPDTGPSTEHPAAVCALDPSACPRLDLTSTTPATAGPQILLTGALAGAPAAGLRSQTLSARISRSVSRAESKVVSQQARAAPEPVSTKTQRNALELREMEAHLSLEVDDVAQGVARVQALAASFGGQVIHEVFEDTNSQYGAALSLRLPTARTSEFLHQVSLAGRVRSRKVQSQDISRKYLDAELLLKNLRATLARYQQLLERAEIISEVAGIEASLARLRTQIERVEGDLRWLADLGARSTIYLKLSSAHSEQDATAPEAKLWPGARGVVLFDLASAAAPERFAGGGLGFAFKRAFGFDVAVLRASGDEAVSLFFASFGGEMYSDYLGGGRRRWLNPYLGFRGAYLHHQDLHEAALGTTLGLELWRSEWMLVDAQLRGYAAFASKLGLHALVEPGIGLSIAF
ncbi:MAG TPA: DUF4349 domain-containing protein [Polyangiaceae bacterium]